jgi:hypothetical protein
MDGGLNVCAALGLVGVAGAIANCSGPSASNTVVMNVATAPPSASDISGTGIKVDVTTPVVAASNWSYSSKKDVMTDRETRTACTISENEVQLDAPYGDVRAELCLRDSPQFGRDAYVALLGDGQILCRSYESCTVKVRFDEAAPTNWSAIGSSDNSTNIFFIEARERLERALKSADRTIIQAEFYQAGNQAMVFNTHGLKWPDAAGKAARGNQR